MSRTYRRKNGQETQGSHNSLKWALRECVRVESGNWYRWEWIDIDPNSEEGKRRTAKYHSDAGTHSFKEPGPSWFRNMFAERPLRQRNKQELIKFMKDPDNYEPMVEEKGKLLPYWT